MMLFIGLPRRLCLLAMTGVCHCELSKRARQLKTGEVVQSILCYYAGQADLATPSSRHCVPKTLPSVAGQAQPKARQSNKPKLLGVVA